MRPTPGRRGRRKEAKPHLDPGFITTVRVPFDVPPGTALDRVESTNRCSLAGCSPAGPQ